MKLTTFKQYMPALYFASAEDHGLAVDLKGRPGHGKTWTIEQFPIIMKELFPDKNYGIRIIEGASLTHTGALGYYILGAEDKYGPKTTFSTPFWMYTNDGHHLSEYDGGILVIDDWHLIDPDLKKLMSQGAYQGIFANHVLSNGWVIWFVGNRPIDRSGATRDYDHTITRQMRVDISDDLEGLIEYFETHGSLPETIEFAKKYAYDHIYVDPPKEQGPYCTPRTLDQSDKFLQKLMLMFGSKEPPTDVNVLEFVSGSIGKPAAHDYITYIEEANALPKYEVIIKNPTTVPLPTETRPDLWRLQCYKLASDVQVKHANQAMQYMERFPQEFVTIFVRAAINNKNSIMFQPKFREWCGKNTALIAAISGLQEAAE